LYTYSDSQGPLFALADVNGNFVERYAFDPWGARRNPTDWKQKDLRTKWITNRGYTWHEHLDAFGIINMNGRVYDPLTAMFFSPDPYVQAPGNWLNYNRYGYCYGNPFRYTDPTGEFIFTALAAIFCPPLLPFAIGADIGMWSGGSIANGTMNPFKWNYSSEKTWAFMGAGAIIGGFSAGVGSSVTSTIGATLTLPYGGLIATGIGGASGGALGGFGFTALEGGNPFDGAWKGALSGLAGGLVGGYITGEAGAFVGGATAAGVNTALNGGDLNDIGSSALFGGIISFGAYELTSYINFKTSNTTLSREQFDIMSRSAQKSFTRGREYGGWLTSDGGVEMWPNGNNHTMTPTSRPENASGWFHTHPNLGGTWEQPPGVRDGAFTYQNRPLYSLVISRQNFYFQATTNWILLSSNVYFNPYPYNNYYFKP
jgi:RHS repeat-associated protein